MNDKIDDPRRWTVGELLTEPGDELLTPQGRWWLTTSERCDCGDDDGLRYEDDYHRYPTWYCDGCGMETDW